MIQALPGYRDILRHNDRLPPDLRGRAVVLQFAKAIPKPTLDHFYRIHMTPRMMAGGEEDFHQSEVWQPHRVGPQLCLTCRQPMKREGQLLYRCQNAVCRQRDGMPTQELQTVSGPVRGVVKVLTAFQAPYEGRQVDVSFLVGRETRTICGRPVPVDMVSGCVLVLDRRYHDVVLCAVWRTAGLLCDTLGIGMK